MIGVANVLGGHGVLGYVGYWGGGGLNAAFRSGLIRAE